MAERPSALPEFASDPGADVTEPSAPIKASGWTPGNPELDFMNWIHVTTYKWIAWFKQLLWPTDLILANGPLPGGSAPVTGAGRVVAAGSFSGRGVVNEVVVELTDGPALTYTGSRDTYWDLSDEAGWTAVVVMNGAGEPAVTANSERFYKVVTDATDRTAVVDYRPPYWRQLATDFVGGVRRFWPASTAIATTIATQAELATAHETFISGDMGTSPQSYETIRAYRARPSASISDIFEHLTEEDGAVQVVRTQGIRVNPASSVNKWLADDAEGWLEFNHVGRRTVWYIAGLTPASAYSDAALIALNPILREDLFHGLRIDTNGAADEGTPHVEHVRLSLGYTPWAADRGTDEAINVYSTDNFLGTGVNAYLEVFNATYNAISGQWDRTVAGACWLKAITPNGPALYTHLAASATNFADSIASGTWEVVEQTDPAGLWTAPNGVRPATTAPATPQNHTLYRDNVPKAWGVLTTSGGGAAAIVSDFNVSGVAISGTSLRVTLATGFASIDVYGGNANVVSGTTNPARLVPVTGTTFDIRTGDDLAATACRFFFAVYGNQ